MNKKTFLKEITSEKIKVWVAKHYLQLAIFNLFLLILVLLRSAGYFEPFLSLSINLITFISLVFVVLLFNSRSGLIFFIGAIFWMGSAFLRILGIEVWAERTAIYTVQTIFLGLILIIIENFKRKKE